MNVTPPPGTDRKTPAAGWLPGTAAHGRVIAREDRSVDLPALFARGRVGPQCEGCDLNAWTPTGADLESAAVSRLGYPRTHLPFVAGG